jgi:DNA-binding NarL/FixJ family response regulator
LAVTRAFQLYSGFLCESFQHLREREVLDLVRQGLSNREIADRLTIEVGTVKNHMHNVLRKLNVRSRHEAAQFA